MNIHLSKIRSVSLWDRLSVGLVMHMYHECVQHLDPKYTKLMTYDAFWLLPSIVTEATFILLNARRTVIIKTGFILLPIVVDSDESRPSLKYVGSMIYLPKLQFESLQPKSRRLSPWSCVYPLSSLLPSWSYTSKVASKWVNLILYGIMLYIPSSSHNDFHFTLRTSKQLLLACTRGWQDSM